MGISTTVKAHKSTPNSDYQPSHSSNIGESPYGQKKIQEGEREREVQ